jgi:hypothetical protein
LARTIIGGLALMAAIAHIVVLAVVFHVSGITPFMLTLMIHVALGLLSHRFALHALPPLRVRLRFHPDDVAGRIHDDPCT